MSDEMDDPTNIEYGQDMIDSKTEEPPTKKRRRTAKPNSDRKFECKHEGCGKSYSRAEHLYRHQLNRKLIRLGALPFLTILQTLQKTFIGVTIQIAIDISSDRISVFDIGKDTPLMAPSYTRGTAMLKRWQIRTTYLRHLRKCPSTVPAPRNWPTPPKVLLRLAQPSLTCTHKKEANNSTAPNWWPIRDCQTQPGQFPLLCLILGFVLRRLRLRTCEPKHPYAGQTAPVATLWVQLKSSHQCHGMSQQEEIAPIPKKCCISRVLWHTPGKDHLLRNHKPRTRPSDLTQCPRHQPVTPP